MHQLDAHEKQLKIVGIEPFLARKSDVIYQFCTVSFITAGRSHQQKISLPISV
jgi:hypothetical protein